MLYVVGCSVVCPSFQPPLTHPSLNQSYTLLPLHPPTIDPIHPYPSPTNHALPLQVGGLDFVRVAMMPDKDQLDARERTFNVCPIVCVRLLCPIVLFDARECA